MTLRSVVMAGLAAGLLGCALSAGCAARGGGSAQPPRSAIIEPLPTDAGPPTLRPVAPGAAFAAGALPATYAGVVPCADCPGIRWTLNLYPDGVFRQRLEYLERSVDGRPARFDDSGRWTLEANGGLLVLRGDGGSTDLFAPRGDDTLRKLDAEGREIPTTLNYDLKRAPAFAPF